MSRARNILAAGALGLMLTYSAAAQSYAGEIIKGRTLTAADADQIEISLKTNTNDSNARARLLSYYSLHAGKDAAMHAARLKQILWLIENSPASTLLHNPVAALQASDFEGPNGDYLKLVRLAWQKQIEGGRVAVIENAVQSLAPLDLNSETQAEEFAGYLKRLRTLEPGDPQWAMLLADLYCQALSRSGQASTEAQLFAASVRADLTKSDDAAIVGLTGRLLDITVQMLGAGNGASTAQGTVLQLALRPLREFSASLLQRAATLNPKNPNWAMGLSKAPPKNLLELAASFTGALEESDLWPGGTAPEMKVPAGGVRVSQEVVEPKQISAIAPAPSNAPACNVRFNVLIGNSGDVKDVHVAGFTQLNIPFLSAQRDALREAHFKPVQADGRPVEAVMQIERKCPVPRQFVPPTAVINNPAPKLAMAPTILAPPDANLPNRDGPIYGDPLGRLAPASNGTGSGTGIGSGEVGGAGYGDDVSRADSGVSKPELIKKVEPEYTEQARQSKLQGVVVLSIVVDPNGNVLNPKVIRGLGMGLDEKAVQAVLQWKFKPGYKDGKPVPVAAAVQVNFVLM